MKFRIGYCYSQIMGDGQPCIVTNVQFSMATAIVQAFYLNKLIGNGYHGNQRSDHSSKIIVRIPDPVVSSISLFMDAGKFRHFFPVNRISAGTFPRSPQQSFPCSAVASISIITLLPSKAASRIRIPSQCSSQSGCFRISSQASIWQCMKFSAGNFRIGEYRATLS